MEATLTATPLFDQVQIALNNSPYLPSRVVKVEAADGHVRLEGTVSSFYQKQMAQELVRRVDGVEMIENQLQVNWG
ncbi:MAG: transport-associated protein [Planctomycetaceae bacterium]|nr:transport-associated protein [Planctomycetaceae bacterium]HCK40883.1 transport-associated protein [Planctomycetaceae bacterium]